MGSNAKVGSVKRKDLSVLTPSIIAKENTKHQTSIFHPSNPNPQNKTVRYRGVRDIGYYNYEKMMDPLEILKFGKKVSYEQKMSQNELLEDHLRQVRNNLMNKS